MKGKRDSPGAVSSESTSTVQELGDLFEQNWRPEHSLDELAGYLPPADKPGYLPALVELACRDLERRLQVGQQARAEQYLRRFPALGQESAAAVEVIATEFQQRRSREASLAVEEYGQRFPQLAAELAEHLQPKGPVVPGYQILGVLARGGMGVVYRAQHLGLKRVVALKMILAGTHAGEEDLARFRREAEAAARLQHPHIVQIHDVGEHNRLPYLAMEFVESGSLDQKLRATAQPARAAAEMVETLARAVHHAHQRGVVHRDLKPANVLLTADGQPKITDFGLAKRLDVEAGQTRTGAIVGTPSYMAPEQAAGRSKDVGATADVYALGAVLYEMLTGRPPFNAVNLMDTLKQVVQDEPVPPRRLQPKVPHDLETICLKCLHKDPRKRYASAEALADDLRRFWNGEPILARPVGRIGRLGRWCRRNPRVAVLLAMVLLVSLVALAAAGWAVQRDLQARDLEVKRLAAETEAANEKARAQSQEVSRLAAETDAANEKARASQAARAAEERRRRQSEAVDWERRAAVAEAEQFYQEAALDYAKALETFDTPATRGRWMEALEHLMVPVETSSWRVFTGWLAYTPDGQELISGDFFGGSIRIWSADTGKLRLVLQGHAPRNVGEINGEGLSFVRGIAFLPGKPKEIVSVGRDGMIRIWDRQTGAELRHSSGGTSAGPAPRLLALAIEPVVAAGARRRILTGDVNGNLVWWDAESLEKVREARGAPLPQLPYLNAVCYRPPDGRELASTGEDGVVRLWDPEGNWLATLVPGELAARAAQTVALAASPLGMGPGLAVVDLLSRSRPPLGPPLGMLDLAYSPDGRQLASAGSDGRIYLWDTATRKLVRRLEGHEAVTPKGGLPTRFVRKLAYASPERLFSGGVDGTIREWDLTTGKQSPRPPWQHGTHILNSRSVRGLALRPDGRQIASSGSDGSICIWDVQHGKLVAQLEGNLDVTAEVSRRIGLGTSAFCADKHLLITDSQPQDAYLRAWDTQTLRERRAYTGLQWIEFLEGPNTLNERRISALAIHPDGSRFVSSEPNGDLVWWVTETGQTYRVKGAHQPLDGHELARQLAAHPETVDGVKYAREGNWSWQTVTALAWSHNGKWVASTGQDRRLRIWNAQTREPIAGWTDEDPEEMAPAPLVRQPEHLKLAYFTSALAGGSEPRRDSVLFDSADATLIAAGQDQVIRVWDIEKKKLVDNSMRHAQRVNALALSADASFLASGSTDGMVIIWDLKKRVPWRQTPLTPLLSRDLKHALFAVAEHEQQMREDLARQWFGAVRSLAFSPDGYWLAAVLGDGSVSLIEVLSGAVHYRGLGHATDVRGISMVSAYFTREGELLTVGGDGSVRHWDLPAWSVGRQVRMPEQGNPPVPRCTDPSGWVVQAGGSVFRWIRQTNRLQLEWKNVPNRANAVSWGREDGKILLATVSGRALVLDLSMGQVVQEFKGPRGDRQPRLPLGAEQPRFNGEDGYRIDAVAVQREGSLAATSWMDGSVDLWHIDNGRYEGTLKRGPVDAARSVGYRVSALAFRPDGRQLAISYGDGELRLWDVDAKKRQFPNRRLQGPTNGRALCYSPDGQELVHAGDGHNIDIWDPAQGVHKQTLRGHDTTLPPAKLRMHGISSAAYSRDGRWLFTGGSDGTIRLWDRQNRLQPAGVLSVRSIRSGNSPDSVLPELNVETLAVDPEGSALIAVSTAGTIRVYDLSSVGRLLALPPEKVLAETEARTTLRLQGDRPVPLPQNQLVREGQSLRPAFE
jgi:WD40 repeat protein